MEEKLLIAVASAVLPVAIGGVGLIIAMRVEIAVLKEKSKYQSGQIRSLLRRARMADAAAKED